MNFFELNIICINAARLYFLTLHYTISVKNLQAGSYGQAVVTERLGAALMIIMIVNSNSW